MIQEQSSVQVVVEIYQKFQTGFLDGECALRRRPGRFRLTLILLAAALAFAHPHMDTLRWYLQHPRECRKGLATTLEFLL